MNKTETTNGSELTFEIRPYTKKELVNLYGITPRILRRWFSENKELSKTKYQRMFSVSEMEVIFQKFGIPKKIKL